MAHKKAAWSAKNLRDSNAQYRGVKLFGGQSALAGNIIVRQKGDKYLPGENTYKAKDFTIHASIDGVVQFRKKNKRRYDGRKYVKTIVDVVPADEIGTENEEKTGKKQEKTQAKKDTTKQTKKKKKTKQTAKKQEKKPAKKTTKTDTKDDLAAIKGVGPKTVEALHAAGITTYQGMIEAGEDGIKQALEDAGTRVTDPTPWIKEAKKLIG